MLMSSICNLVIEGLLRHSHPLSPFRLALFQLRRSHSSTGGISAAFIERVAGQKSLLLLLLLLLLIVGLGHFHYHESSSPSLGPAFNIPCFRLIRSGKPWRLLDWWAGMGWDGLGNHSVSFSCFFILLFPALVQAYLLRFARSIAFQTVQHIPGHSPLAPCFCGTSMQGIAAILSIIELSQMLFLIPFHPFALKGPCFVAKRGSS